jgi:hypothetical protein
MKVVRQFQVRGATGFVTHSEFDGRRVDFWAPPEPTHHLVVAHDGQNIFDKKTATRHRTWGLAGRATKVARELGLPTPAIIAVFHSSTHKDPYGRGKDLAPQDFFRDGLEPVIGVPGIWPTPAPSFPLSMLRGNQYLHDINQNIVPTICEYLSHDLVPEKTAMLGASMGALATLYNMTKYPELYRTALAFSTHWTVGGHALVDGLMGALPAPGNHKLWMSRGTKSLDADYEPYQERANQIAGRMGYGKARDLSTPIFPRTSHNEDSWASYLNQALRFWLAD